VRTTSSHHGPYGQGDTRATMGRTKRSKTVRWSKSINLLSVRIAAATRLHEAGITRIGISHVTGIRSRGLELNTAPHTQWGGWSFNPESGGMPKKGLTPAHRGN